MSAKEEWKDPLTPKDLSLAEEVIDEQQAEIDELVEMLEWTTVNDEVRQFQRSAEILALIAKHKAEEEEGK